MHYVIGDIHGYFTEFMDLVDKIEQKDPEAEFIITGDLIDRGPEVMETVLWAMKNIGPGKKFQSILGNHEDMVLNWYHKDYQYWMDNYHGFDEKLLLEPRYDFKEVLSKAGILRNRMEVGKIMDFFSSLPLYMELTVDTASGMKQTYKIAHGYYKDPDSFINEDNAKIRRYYIWDRQDTGFGHEKDDYIVVHGHTPTVELECIKEYYYAKDPEPVNRGLIAYRKNTINVDGGRPYKDDEKHFCTICAICLENLKEYYAVDLPADYNYKENRYQKEMIKKVRG